MKTRFTRFPHLKTCSNCKYLAHNPSWNLNGYWCEQNLNYEVEWSWEWGYDYVAYASECFPIEEPENCMYAKWEGWE